MSKQIRSCRSFVPALALGALTLGGLAACHTPEAVMEDAEEPAQLAVTIATVPTDVACLRLTAIGKARTVVKLLEVKGGDSFSKTFGGLPLGAIVFTGEAFHQACDDVTTTTVPGWVSEPETVSIALNRLASISMVMQRNGRAKFDVTFSDEPLCSTAGDVCKTNRDCCSQDCRHGTCQAGDGGVEADAAQ